MSDRRLIKVRYTCEKCGISAREVEVQARLEGEDIVLWVENVLMLRIGDDHRRCSPECRPKTLTNVRVPLEDGRPIGAAVP